MITASLRGGKKENLRSITCGKWGGGEIAPLPPPFSHFEREKEREAKEEEEEGVRKRASPFGR